MNILQLALVSGKLKRLPRTGWGMSNVKNPESVAEHSFRVGLLAMSLAGELGLSQEKSMKMALVHDLAEAEIGDIVIQRGDKILVNADEKHEKEHDAMVKIANETKLDELVILFKEYSLQESPEAQLVKQVDRLEMLIQAYEYEQEQGIDLEEFFLPTRKEITHPKVRELLNELDLLRHEK